MLRMFMMLMWHRLIFIISYVALIGMSISFHFYLGHEISEIENWLFYYSGLILMFITFIRFFFAFIFFDKNLNFLEILNEFIRNILLIKKEILSILVLLGMFFYFYFQYLPLDNFVKRGQLISKQYVLLIIICLDIFSTHLLMFNKKRSEILKYGLLDCLIVVIGILCFYQNLHLNLIFMAFYLGCYGLYLITANIMVVPLYWLFILLPVSILKNNTVDFFSVDYKENFSVLIIILAHLLPYIWYQLVGDFKEDGKYTT